MCSAHQPNDSPRSREIARQTVIGPIVKTAGIAVIPRAAAENKRGFDPYALLVTIGEGRKLLHLQNKKGIFTRGDLADTVFCLQTGKVKLTLVSKTGK